MTEIAREGAPLRIWVDTDIALGARRGDVDDGFALAAVALAAKQGQQGRRPLELVGVSSVSGNTDGRTAARAARDLLEVIGGRAGRVPVVDECDAPEAMAELADGASVLAIGPPTNLVRAASVDPGFPSRVEVRVVGSVLDRRRHPLLGFFCLNFRRDPEATASLFRLRWRRRLVFPLDVVRRLRFDAGDLDKIRASSPLGGYLAEHSARWLRRAPLRYLSASFPVWDLVAALHAIGDLPGVRVVPETERIVAFDVDGARRVFFHMLGADG